MMLYSAVIFALVLGTAVSSKPWPGQREYPTSRRHQMGINPFVQARHPLTQGFLCDWCVVGVEDSQAAVRENLAQVQDVLNKVSALCVYCPVQEQCEEVFNTDIPAAINEFLNETPNTLCTEAGVCDANATIQGMVMNSLRGDFARDRVIKRMLMRARVMQQKMIRIILGEDYMCTSCLDIVGIAREALLNNDTEHEFVQFLAPLCAYLPDVYQTECTEFVQGLPDLLRMVANDILTDSLCTEIGFCNQTKSTPDLTLDLPDVMSRLGLPGVLPVMPGRQNPFQFPGGGRQQPFQFPGQGRTPYGYPSRPREYPSQSRPSNGRNPFQFPSNTRPEQQPAPINWPGSTYSRPSKPQKPVDPSVDQMKIPDIDMDDYLSKIGGIMDRLPSIPDMPDMGLPDIDLPFRLSGVGRNDQSRRNEQSRRNDQSRGNGGRRQQRRQRSVGDWTATVDQFLGVPKDEIHEYLPESIPDAGFVIIEEGADENCELCKVAVTAASSWFEENAPKLKKMLSKLVVPVCKIFPSPMKEDCTSDMRELVQTAIERLAALLNPEAVCTEVGICVAPEEGEEFYPTTEIVMATDAAVEVDPTTDAAGVNWPIPILNKWKDFKFPL